MALKQKTQHYLSIIGIGAAFATAAAFLPDYIERGGVASNLETRGLTITSYTPMQDAKEHCTNPTALAGTFEALEGVLKTPVTGIHCGSWFGHIPSEVKIREPDGTLTTLAPRYAQTTHGTLPVWLFPELKQ